MLKSPKQQHTFLDCRLGCYIVLRYSNAWYFNQTLDLLLFDKNNNIRSLNLVNLLIILFLALKFLTQVLCSSTILLTVKDFEVFIIWQLRLLLQTPNSNKHVTVLYLKTMQCPPQNFHLLFTCLHNTMNLCFLHSGTYSFFLIKFLKVELNVLKQCNSFSSRT
jgi:hypothetical protein